MIITLNNKEIREIWCKIISQSRYKVSKDRATYALTDYRFSDRSFARVWQSKSSGKMAITIFDSTWEKIATFNESGIGEN